MVDVITPGHPKYNEKAHLAKTVRVDSAGKMVWGALPKGEECKQAHGNKNVNCIACHSSWNPSCYGCHLPQKANSKTPQLHNDGDVTRNITSYNFQTLREDVFMLARDGDVTGNRIGPARSSCAIHVGSYNGNRESIYFQQQTISGEGLSGIAFSTNVPHTVRGKDGTKQCTDCHISKENDNNAILAQLLMQGTNYLNFMGRYCWVAEGEHGLAAVEVTEREEPQAVYGSRLQQLAFPDYYRKHLESGRVLQVAHEHPGMDVSDQFLKPGQKIEVLGVQNRGEYVYAACGSGGIRIFDISFLDHKGFSQRVFSAPVSPLGQKFYVPSRYCTAVAAPTTLAPDPTRTHRPENNEPKVPAMYGSIYATDKYEGLIIVGVATLIDGNPQNNFLKRDVTFNPNGALCGANSISIVGTYAYICCDAGLVAVSIADPAKPEIKAIVGPPFLNHPHAVQVQFRYAYVCDAEGVKVLDVTDLEKPRPVSRLALPVANNIYLARTYAYVAGGPNGMIILDIEKPEAPRIDQVYNAGGCLNDVRDIKLAITYVSEFAYVADGKNGMAHRAAYFSRDPRQLRLLPEVYAGTHCHLQGTRGWQGAGHYQGARPGSSGRREWTADRRFRAHSARPLNLEEQRRMYLRNGMVWQVSDDPKDAIYTKVGRP